MLEYPGKSKSVGITRQIPKEIPAERGSRSECEQYPRSAVAVVSARNTRGARISRSECAKYPRGAD